MKYKKGDRVKNPKMEKWGLGEVLEDCNSEVVRIFFVDVGEKNIYLKIVQPIIVPKEEAHHPVLDNLCTKTSTTKIKYKALPDSIKHFQSKFPEGFYDPKFLDEERTYKVQAHDLAIELLNNEIFEQLLNNSNYHEICRRALKIVNSTNLIFPNEKMAFKDGLIRTDAERLFSFNLYELLYGLETIENRFISFLKLLEEIDADKWTTVSYFLFIFQPDKFMFVKPTITQHAAEMCGYEINYKPQLNWQTYKLVLEFSEYLKTGLSELEPRDMIDVQSFMWCIAPR